MLGKWVLGRTSPLRTDSIIPAWVSHLIISVVYVSWFELRCQSWVLVTETEKIMIMLAPALSSTYQSEYGVGHKHSNVVFSMSWRAFIEYQQWASSYLGYVHCFRWRTSRDAQDILQHWSRVFTYSFRGFLWKNSLYYWFKGRTISKQSFELLTYLSGATTALRSWPTSEFWIEYFYCKTGIFTKSMQHGFWRWLIFKKNIQYFKLLKYFLNTHRAVKFRGIAYCKFVYIEYRVLRIIAVMQSL